MEDLLTRIENGKVFPTMTVKTGEKDSSGKELTTQIPYVRVSGSYTGKGRDFFVTKSDWDQLQNRGTINGVKRPNILSMFSGYAETDAEGNLIDPKTEQSSSVDSRF